MRTMPGKRSGSDHGMNPAVASKKCTRMRCIPWHALPDLRGAAGGLRDGVSVLMEQSTLLDQANGSSG
jgi:hypothetical protein